MSIRLGEMMVDHGLLTLEQVDEVLEAQQRLRRPFGEIAERMFDLDPQAVERVWADQYAQLTQHVDPRVEEIDPAVVALIDRRQAWQFRMLPLRRDDREIMIATLVETLPRSLRFAMRWFTEPCYFVLSDPRPLGEALEKHFAMAGMCAEDLLVAGDNAA